MASTRLFSEAVQKQKEEFVKKGKVLKSLASLKLAVFILIALAIMTAWGTFVEAEFDAAAAQKLVYHSVWMYGIMLLLVVNLIAVMVDRWPWQEKHTGFVLAHIGIIILLAGSVVTRYLGIDGSMSIGIGEVGKHVVTNETDLTVYASLDGSSYRKVFDREVDFFLKAPTRENPLEIPLPGEKLKILEYFPYAFREEKVVEVTGVNEAARAGAAIRFQLQNERVSQTEWLVQPAPGRDVVKDLGPAQVVLTSNENYPGDQTRNTLIFRPSADGSIIYEVRTARDPKAKRQGVVKPGDSVDTGWMGLVLRVLKYHPQAREDVLFKPTDRPTPLTTAAIKVDYNGNEQWLSLNSMLKLFSEQSVYIVTYANRRHETGFPITLKSFNIGRYPGTMRAASYESVVDVPGLGEKVISMNEPLHHAGFTLYQASFNEDEQGKLIASVFSVNWDPGRWIKYLGSLLMVLGTIHLFYFKGMKKKSTSPSA